jgi:hypothetical protein
MSSLVPVISCLQNGPIVKLFRKSNRRYYLSLNQDENDDGEVDFGRGRQFDHGRQEQEFCSKVTPVVAAWAERDSR